MPRSFTAHDLGEVAGITAACTVEGGVAPLIDVIIRMYTAGRMTDAEFEEVKDVLNNSGSRVAKAMMERVTPILQRPDPPAPAVDEIVENATREFREMLGQAVDAIAIEHGQHPAGELPRGNPEQDTE